MDVSILRGYSEHDVWLSVPEERGIQKNEEEYAKGTSNTGYW